MLLLWIAFKLLLEEEEDLRVRESSSVWKAIRTILVADFIMSLDNVLAIAGVAKGDLALIVIGIALSIPIVVWGSGIIVGWLPPVSSARIYRCLYIGVYSRGYVASGCKIRDDALLFIPLLTFLFAHCLRHISCGYGSN